MKWPRYIPMGRLRVPMDNVTGDSEILQGNDAMAEWGAPWPRISVSEDITDDDYRDLTVAHEVIHGWLFQSGMCHLLKEPMQEALCDSMAPFLIQLLEEVEDA